MALQPVEKKLKYQAPSISIWKEIQPTSPTNINVAQSAFTGITIDTKVLDPRDLAKDAQTAPILGDTVWLFTAPKARTYNIDFVCMIRTALADLGYAAIVSSAATGATTSTVSDTHFHTDPQGGQTGDYTFSHAHTYFTPGLFYTSIKRHELDLVYYNKTLNTVTRFIFPSGGSSSENSSIIYQPGSVICSVIRTLSANPASVMPITTINGSIQGSLYMNAGDQLFFLERYDYTPIQLGGVDVFNINATLSYFVDINEVTERV